MSFPHLGGVLKLGFTSSFVPISKSVLDDALQFYTDRGGKFTKGGERVKNGKHIFMHHTKFPCIKQPPGSVKEAFYALHHMKGIVRDSRIRALPANL
jgi:hypothetical protein